MSPYSYENCENDTTKEFCEKQPGQFDAATATADYSHSNLRKTEARHPTTSYGMVPTNIFSFDDGNSLS